MNATRTASEVPSATLKVWLPSVEDTMALDLREAVQARAPEMRSMREGWISFGSIKLAANTPDGLLGIADHRRVAEAFAW